VQSRLGALDFYLGGATEDASSVNPDSTSRSSPFSVFARRNRRNGMLRPNPQGTEGRISSALAGVTSLFTAEDVSARTAFAVEAPFDAPGDARFVQASFTGELTFLTFGAHTVYAGMHALVSAGDPTPRQRFGYLGGSGTLPTADLLVFGGDEMLFVDGLYTVPVERLRLPVVGAPSVGLRYAAGSAGVRELPRFTQNVGVRLAVSLARVDLLVNPATGETTLSAGVGLVR
jgi:hypothetical protein